MPNQQRFIDPPLVSLRRTWGDGQKQGAHVIGDISFADGSIKCTCGAGVFRARGLTLEDAWDVHRGRSDLVTDRVLSPSREPRANDTEVSAFLNLAANPSYELDA